MDSHEIDFELFGDDMQFVEIELDPKETVVAEAGAMMMDNNIEMETIFGDGSIKSRASGFFRKLGGATKRILTGESLFMTTFTNMGTEKEKVSFASPYPGKIIPVDLRNYEEKLICQKDAFLCAAKGVSIGIDFRKKLGTGFFGGEGIFFASLEGPGEVWIQSLPFSRLASKVVSSASQVIGGKDVGEGSVIGKFGSLFQN